MNKFSFSIQDIANHTNGTIIGSAINSLIEHIFIDSRKFTNSDKRLFIAIKGVNHDAHTYIADLYSKGLRCFLVDDKELDFDKYPAATFVCVDNSILALQQLAAKHRNTFTKPLISITGSNGKTIIKEWLSNCLAKDCKVYKSPKSYNSQVGVPLSLLGLDLGDDIAIIEAGISQSGEMKKLQSIINPDLGIFTNIGQAHSENFNSVEEKIKEKLILFSHSKKLIYCEDHTQIHKQICNSFKGEPITWSKKNKACFLYINSLESSETETTIECISNSIQNKYTLPFTDEASIENILHIICTLLALGYSASYIQHCLADLSSVEMRLELIEAKANSLLINDSYSSDLDSLKIALDFLVQQKGNAKTVAILSDLDETGIENKVLYPKLMQLLDNYQIDKVIGIGANFTAFNALFSNCSGYKSTNEFIENIHHEDLEDSAILLKGARRFEFEKIAKLLEQKIHETVLEVNLNAISENYHYYKNQLKPQTKVMVMVKAFSYGNGSYEIAHLLEYHQADYLAVAYVDEGIALRKKGIQLPIMVLNPDIAQFPILIQQGLEPEIYSFRQLKALSREVIKAGLPHYPIHLKVDTGMHRLGFDSSNIDDLTCWLQNHKEIKLNSVFSHLSSSDNIADKEFSHLQIDRYKDICTKLENKLGYSFLKHILNSAGIINFPEAQLDMVRLGIGLYGIGQANLSNCSSLKTMISQIKTVPMGESIGYNRAYITKENITIAIIPIGYADGLSRALSKGIGKVYIKEQEAPIIGNICMDMCMIDVSHIEDAKEGDEVIIWNSQKHIMNIANSLNTIAYEVLTNISQRVKRVFIQE